MCWQSVDSRSRGALVREVRLYDARDPIEAGSAYDRYPWRSVSPPRKQQCALKAEPADTEPRLRSISPTREQRYTLKVTIGDDIRRLQAAWPRHADSRVKYAAIHKAVRDSLNTRSDSNDELVLQYEDDEKDFCSLMPETVHDCLSLACSNVLRLKVKLGNSVEAATNATSRCFNAPLEDTTTFQAESTSASSTSLCDFNVLLDDATTFQDPSDQSQSGTIEEEYDCAWEMVEGAGAI